MRIRRNESLPFFLSYPRLLGFLMEGPLREFWGAPFLFLVRCHFCLSLSNKNTGQVETGCQFFFFETKIDLPRSTDQPNQTLSGGGLNFAVGLWC